MKKIKKLLAMIMAMTMVLGMAMTVSAAEGDNWTIKITGTGISADDENLSVKYGQIIKADTLSTQGWSFVSEEIEAAFVNGWNSVDSGNATAEDVIGVLISEVMKENPENKNATSGAINQNAHFSAALISVSRYATTVMDITDGANVEDTGAGLYIVVAQKNGYTYLPMAAYMNSAGTDVTVQAKGSEDQLYKTVDGSGESVTTGDIVQYTIHQEYLYIRPEANPKTFTISDTITNGTIDPASLVVKYAPTLEAEASGTPLVEGENYEVTFGPESEDKTTFTLDFGTHYDPELAGQVLIITYNVTIGALPADDDTTVVSNQASSSTGTGQIVETKPVSFTVIKENEEEERLGGAVFYLYKEVGEEYPGSDKETLVYNGETKYVIKVGEMTTSAVEGPTKGTATVHNLDAQATYYIREYSAPTGYSVNDTVYQLAGAERQDDTTTEKAEGEVTYDVITHNYDDFNDQLVVDTKLASLPSTGGIGTTIFTIGGCAIMIAAAALYFVNRRKSEEN